jgi:hypothetical protein
MGDSVVDEVILFRVKVKFDYDADDETELTIGAGEILAVFKTADNGWWFAEATDGACGWVPSNFLEISDDAEYLEEEEPDLLKGGTTDEVQEINFSEAEIIEPEEMIAEVEIEDKNLKSKDAVCQVIETKKKKDPLSHLAIAQAGQEGCGLCSRIFPGAYIMDSNERKYHEECFNCFHCEKSLLQTGFVEKDGNLYCEKDFYDLFSPKCAHCKLPITSQYVKALGRTYHPDHFVCKVCSNPFTDGMVFQYKDEPYCQTHYQELFAVKCGYCDKGILGRGFTISEIEKSFHEECFFCNAPQKHLLRDGEAFHVHDGKLFCGQHFKEVILTKCHKCKKIIESDYLTVKDTNFHVECFKCESCDISILDGKFSIFKDKFVCLFCAKKAKQEMEVQSNKATPDMPTTPSQTDVKKSREAAAAKRMEPSMKYGSAEAHQANEGVVPKQEEQKEEKKPQSNQGTPHLRPKSNSNAAQLLAAAANQSSPSIIPKSAKSKNSELTPPEPSEKLKAPSPNSRTPIGSLTPSRSKEPSPRGSQQESSASSSLTPEAKRQNLFADAKRKSMMAKRPESFINPSEKVFSYDLLKSKDDLPDGVDPRCKEKYLSEEEFQFLFKMNRDAFYTAPQWRQIKLKQEKNLF